MMALKVVLIISLVLSWTDKSFQTIDSSSSTSELTGILNTLQKCLTPSSCDSLNLVTQVLIREIEARVVQQERLENRITELQNQLTGGQAGPVVTFSAQVGVHQRGLTAQQRIPFQDIVTNIGGGYNGDTSTFRCPVRGVYQFDVTILSEPNDRIETELIAARVSQMKIFSGGVTYYGSGSNTVLLLLEAGDEVFVRLHLSYGTQLHSRWSTFNGHLVRIL